MVGPLSFRSLSQSAAEAVREAIISGKLKPGERLVEQKLAANLGIGQPTLREALKELEYQGFVRKIPHKGSYVTRLTREDFQKILEVRLTLESLAVSRAAERITEKTATQFKQIVDDMKAAAEAMDRSAFHRCDIAFHRKMWEVSDNEYLALALESIVFALFASVLFQQQRADFLAAAQQHRAMLLGLLSGDPALAVKAFQEQTIAFWKKRHQVELDSN
jgi:DNA-binding GntR family transcriptional regulator